MRRDFSAISDLVRARGGNRGHPPTRHVDRRGRDPDRFARRTGSGGHRVREDRVREGRLRSGRRLVREDFDGDGYPDLAVGVPGEAIGSKAKAGAVVLLKGDKDGLTGKGARAFHQDTADVPGAAEPGDVFGGSVRLLDVTRDGRADLVAGAPGEDLGAVRNGGAVWLLRGAAAGLTASRSSAQNPTDIGAPAAKALFGLNPSGHNGSGTVIP
ncbi:MULTISPECIES: FG-GAP-like repeat-containing protein [Streptomyces]|uniref:FG-GAP repeat protein n=1 Tax=Streptomyces TaxID=1883 RepID=UPI001CC2312C|nr:FG-GAP-like repeat-containing protein [Streptomyces venezuelae]